MLREPSRIVKCAGKNAIMINKIKLVCLGLQRKTLMLLTVVNENITAAFVTPLLCLYFLLCRKSTLLFTESTLALVSLFMTLLLFLLVAMSFPILLTMRNKFDKNISTITR